MKCEVNVVGASEYDCLPTQVMKEARDGDGDGDGFISYYDLGVVLKTQ